jgi:elongation factor P
MKIKAGSVRKGHIIIYNNNKVEVTETTHITPGRRSAIVHIYATDIFKNTKHDIRCTPEDEFEQISIYNTPHVYSYNNGEAFIFMNTKNYEEVLIPNESLDEEKSKFLVAEQEIFLGLDEDGQYVNIVWPIKTIAKVKSAPPNQKNASSDDKKRVILENGANLIVPGYVKEGDEIIINLESMEFVGRN